MSELNNTRIVINESVLTRCIDLIAEHGLFGFAETLLEYADIEIKRDEYIFLPKEKFAAARHSLIEHLTTLEWKNVVSMYTKKRDKLFDKLTDDCLLYMNKYGGGLVSAGDALLEINHCFREFMVEDAGCIKKAFEQLKYTENLLDDKVKS